MKPTQWTRIDPEDVNRDGEAGQKLLVHFPRENNPTTSPEKPCNYGSASMDNGFVTLQSLQWLQGVSVGHCSLLDSQAKS